MDMNGTPCTPVQSAMLNILSDGKRHSAEELQECIKPSGRDVVRVHIHHIRKLLAPKGEDILCVYLNRRRYYQHIRLLNSPYDGRT